MNNLNCEYVREVYPDVLHGHAVASTITAVRAHIAGCADCREEAELVERLQAATITVPAGLQERITAQVTAPRARRIAPRHVALAATVAAALIGGPLLLDSLRSPNSRADLPRGSGLGVVTVEAAMVTGTGSLQDLTVEELEQLLGEIES